MKRKGKNSWSRGPGQTVGGRETMPTMPPGSTTPPGIVPSLVPVT
jgi:hypothetical protein